MRNKQEKAPWLLHATYQPVNATERSGTLPNMNNKKVYPTFLSLKVKNFFFIELNGRRLYEQLRIKS